MPRAHSALRARGQPVATQNPDPMARKYSRAHPVAPFDAHDQHLDVDVVTEDDR